MTILLGNDFLSMASTFHSLHAIASQISPNKEPYIGGIGECVESFVVVVLCCNCNVKSPWRRIRSRSAVSRR